MIGTVIALLLFVATERDVVDEMAIGDGDEIAVVVLRVNLFEDVGAGNGDC